MNSEATDRATKEGRIQDLLEQLASIQAELTELTGAPTLGPAPHPDEQTLALYNARLYEQIRTNRQELQTLSRRLVQVQEAERRALAREIHDTSSQTSTALKLGLAMLKRERGCDASLGARIDELRQIAETLGEDLHRLSVNLRPSSLDRYGLVPALDQLIASVRKQTGMQIDFLAQDLDERLPDEIETALYRIVQEATTNISRYARATYASVMVQRDGDTVRLIVEDNGQGFDLDEALRKGRLGLPGMRERAEMLSGTFDIESSPGSGTTLYVQVPASGGAVSQDEDALAQETTVAEPHLPQGRRRDAAQGAQAEDFVHQAAELARAKALSDALVEITAGMAACTTAEQLLELVLARSAEAIGCESAAILEREGDHWVVTHGHGTVSSLVGRRLSNEEAPAMLQVEQTGQLVVANDARTSRPEAASAAADYAVLSYACIPLLVGDRLLGAANYMNHSDAVAFTPSEIEFLKRLSALVSLALENAQFQEMERRQRTVLEAIFAGVPVGLAVITGSNFEIKLANASYRSLTPHPEVDPVGQRYAEIWPPVEGFGRGESWLAGVLATGKPLDVEHHRRVFPDGTQHYFAFHVRPLSWAGEPACLVALVDTTETDRAAAEMEAILASVNDGLAVYGPEGQILRLNRAAEAILGYAQADLTAAFAERMRYVRPSKGDGETYAVEEHPVARALRGETVQAAIMTLEQRGGGTTWVAGSAAPIYGPDGARQGAVATFTNITPLRAAQQQLEAANEALRTQANALADERDRLRALLNSIPEEVWFCDAAGYVMAANPAAVRGLQLEDTGESFQSLTDWQDLEILDADGQPRPPEDAPLLRALRGEEVKDQEEIVRMPRTGELRYRQANGDAIRDAAGQILGAVVAVRDVTDARKAAAERQRVQVALAEAHRAAAQSEERYRLLFTAMDQSFALVKIQYDDEGRPCDYVFLDVNPATERRSGLTRAEMVGKSIRQLQPTVAQETIDTYAGIARTGQPGRTTLRSDFAGTWYEIYAYSPGPDLVAILGRDVTEQVRARSEAEARAVAAQAAQERAEALVAERETILDAIADGLVVYDRAGRIVRQNAVAEEMLGYGQDLQDATLAERSASVINVSKPDGSPLAPDQYPAARALRGEVVRNQGMVFRLTHRGNEELRASVSSAPIRAQDGSIIGCVTTLANSEAYYQAIEQLSRREVSLRDAMQSLQEANARLSQRELELQRNVAELDGILSSLPSGLIVYDRDGHIIRINSLAQSMLGYDEETWQRPVGERVSSVVHLSRPDGTPYAWEEYPAIRALHGEEAHNEDVFLHLPAHPAKDFWAMMSACPIQGPDGELLGAVITITDTGELHRASAELTQTADRLLHANAELEAILAAVPAALIVYDTAGKITHINNVALDMLGYPADTWRLPVSERVGGAVQAFWPDGRLCERDEYIAVRAAAGEVIRGQEHFIHLPERPENDFWGLFSAGPILGPGQHPAGSVVTWANTSRLHEVSDQLAAANAQLRAQADELSQREAALREAAERLEQRVWERTAQLAQVNASLEEHRTQLQALSRRLVAMQERERSYVADQLYNQVGQVLAVLQVRVGLLERKQVQGSLAEEWAEMKTALNLAISELHDLATQLRPVGLDRSGLSGFLRFYVSRFGRQHGLAVHFSAEGAEGLRLPPDVATAVYRAVEEALANVARHARASEVSFLIGRLGAYLTISVEDNGVGFDPASAYRHGGVGLIGIREHIESVGGRLTIESEPGSTNVFIEVPLEAPR